MHHAGPFEVIPAYLLVAKVDTQKILFRVSKRFTNRNDVFIKFATWDINHVEIKSSDISSLSILSQVSLQSEARSTC